MLARCRLAGVAPEMMTTWQFHRARLGNPGAVGLTTELVTMPKLLAEKGSRHRVWLAGLIW